MQNAETSDNASRPEKAGKGAKKKQPTAIWVIVLIFVIFVTMVFLTQNRASINWTEDYNAGIQQARQAGKPVLMMMYKDRAAGRFTRVMFEEVFTVPAVGDFLNKNFVPILIDVVKQPDIAKKYNYDYEPTHLVINPESEEIVKTILGPRTPRVFIETLEDGLGKIKEQDEAQD